MANINTITASTETQNTNTLPIFIREINGRYFIKKPVVKNEIIDLAKHLVSQEYQNSKTISSSEESKDFFIFNLAQEKNEVFCAAFLNSQNQIIAFEKLFVGSINFTPVFPREIIKKALLHNAAAVIFAHNHPSCSATPSQHDIHLTKELEKILQAIEVKVLDHIITCGNSAISLKHENLI